MIEAVELMMMKLMMKLDFFGGGVVVENEVGA